MWPHNPTTGFRLSSATVVSAEPFLHGTGTLQCLQKEVAIYRHWSVSLWRDPDYVAHCRILSPDKTEWWFILATLCRWRCCFVADQLWVMTCIREKEEEEVNLSCSCRTWSTLYWCLFCLILIFFPLLVQCCYSVHFEANVTTLHSRYVVAIPSVIYLSVMFVQPTQLLGNIFALSNSLETLTVCVKILDRNSRGSRWSCKLNGRGYEKLVFLDQYVSLFRKRCKVWP